MQNKIGRASSGFRNVYRMKGGFRVALSVDGVPIYGGFFRDLDAAARAAADLRALHFSHANERRPGHSALEVLAAGVEKIGG